MKYPVFSETACSSRSSELSQTDKKISPGLNQYQKSRHEKSLISSIAGFFRNPKVSRGERKLFRCHIFSDKYILVCNNELKLAIINFVAFVKLHANSKYSCKTLDLKAAHSFQLASVT